MSEISNSIQEPLDTTSATREVFGDMNSNHLPSPLDEDTEVDITNNKRTRTLLHQDTDEHFSETDTLLTKTQEIIKENHDLTASIHALPICDAFTILKASAHNPNMIIDDQPTNQVTDTSDTNLTPINTEHIYRTTIDPSHSGDIS